MKIEYYYVMLILIGLIVSCSAGDKDLPSINVNELQAKIQSDTNLVLLDVRTEGEFNGPLGRLDGAMLLPLGELETRMAELEQYKEKEIIVYCRSGTRSRFATSLLR